MVYFTCENKVVLTSVIHQSGISPCFPKLPVATCIFCTHFYERSMFMKSNTIIMPEAQPSYRQATGKMPYSLTNDYLFRALLQKNNRVLKHLICVLLHLQPEEVSTVTTGLLSLKLPHGRRSRCWQNRIQYLKMQ